MDTTNILKGFNNHLDEFMDDIIRVFPNDEEIKKAHISLSGLKKINPKIIIGIWKNYISDNYSNEIDNGNIDFFIGKNYSSDLKDSDYNNQILNKIDRMKSSIKLMDEENKKITIKYLQNLNKLCKLYH